MPKQTKDIKAAIRQEVNSIEKKIVALYPLAKEVTVETMTDGVRMHHFTNKKSLRETVVTVYIKVTEEV